MSREDGRVAVAKNGEVIALDVEEGETKILPSVDPEEFKVFLESIGVDCVGCVDDGEQGVVENGLEGWKRGSSFDEFGGECVRSGDAECEDLPVELLVLVKGRKQCNTYPRMRIM